MSWALSEQRFAHSTERPVRVAHLIDVDETPDELLDAVFAEAYSRWGGRRTLIVPCKKDTGLEKAYGRWLETYDPDIIYSYLDLSDDVIKHIHETFCPLSLIKHRFYGNDLNTPHAFKPDLHLLPLSSLSILPYLLSRGAYHDFTNCQIPDIHWSVTPDRFLTDNYGLLNASYHISSYGENYSELYKALTLISLEAYKDNHQCKSPNRVYETDAQKILECISKSGTILTLSMLSDCLAPYVDFQSFKFNNSFNLVIGETIKDRLLFWNFHHHYSGLFPTEVSSLCVTIKNMEDNIFFDSICNTIKHRFKRNQSQLLITIRSCSLSKEQMEKYKTKLERSVNFSIINIQEIKDFSDYIPKSLSDDKKEVYLRTNVGISGESNTSSNSFTGEEFSIPKAIPHHLNNIIVPAALQQGCWMLDVEVERLADHQDATNRRHIWSLPRRLRIDNAFDRLDNNNDNDFLLQTLRVNQQSLISLPIKLNSSSPILRAPNDIVGIKASLTSPYEWPPFNQSADPQLISRLRFSYARLSDKGRYLVGVLQHFDSLSEAESTFMNVFWKEIFEVLGANEIFVNDGKRKVFVNKIKKKLKITNGKWVLDLSDEEEVEVFANICLREANRISRDIECISWSKINERFKETALVNYEEDKSSLEKSAIFLRQKEVLFQGEQWTCTNCFNKNWVPFNNPDTNLRCEVCGNQESIPITQDWKFRLNGFILEAFKHHGTWAMIWCLKVLRERSKKSFYFSPSLDLFDLKPPSKEYKVAEADLIVVIDGLLYFCEIKSSSRLDPKAKESFIMLANRIRPNIALLAIMKEDLTKKAKLIAELKGKLDPGIALEILVFEENHLEKSFFLPVGDAKKTLGYPFGK